MLCFGRICASCALNVSAALQFTEGTIFAVELVVEYFATAHLFIININSVFEEIIR